MLLVVGVNSYMDVGQADEIVNSSFLSNDKGRVYWNSLTDDDKSVLVYRKTMEIDNIMLYKGKVVDLNQKLKFPRVIRGKVVECPDQVKRGIILQIIKDSELSNSAEGKLRQLGVKSFADGSGASISFSDHAVEHSVNGKVDKVIYDSCFKDYVITV